MQRTAENPVFTSDRTRLAITDVRLAWAGVKRKTRDNLGCIITCIFLHIIMELVGL